MKLKLKLGTTMLALGLMTFGLGTQAVQAQAQVQRGSHPSVAMEKRNYQEVDPRTIKSPNENPFGLVYQLFLIDGATHIQTYWVPEYVNQAVAKLTEFYGSHL